VKAPKKVVEAIYGQVTVGSLLRGYRHNNEVGLDDLAKTLKLPKADLQKIEAGKKRLTLKEVVAINRKLDEPVALYARVWCEEEVRAAGLEFDDVVNVI
jgi:hypothetical protein